MTSCFTAEAISALSDGRFRFPSTVTGATDAANYACICPECLRFSAFVVTDDECDRGVHGTDERITRRAYLQGLRFMIRLIEEACL